MGGTTLINHESRAHSLLSASGASRWMNCTPSARLEEKHGGPDKGSPYAAEGSLAHELAELYIRYDVLKAIERASFEEQLGIIMDNDLFNSEMLDEVPKYVDYVDEQFRASKLSTPDAVLLIEQKVDLTAWVPEAFGTNDAIIIADGVLDVMDLKYGKGVPVSATGNSQLMLYALGSYAHYSLLYDIHTIRLHIIQPRIDNISVWAITVNELLNWAENVVKPKAKLAFEGQGELKAGDWCRFCKVKNRCRALYEENIKLAQYEFKEPDLLTDDEIAQIIEQAPKLIEWVNSITAYAQEQAIEHGKQWPGFKLVVGRSVRKYVDEDAVEKLLLSQPDLDETDIFDMKLKGLTAMQKTLGKTRFESLLGDLIIKPEGKPTLVPISDKRPALGIEDAQNDFKD